MPLAVVEKIVSLMSVADLVAYGGSCKVNYDVMHAIIKRRIKTVIQSFGLPYQAFYNMLHGQYAVISGSVVLHVFDPSEGWTLEDMDIYVPKERARRVVNRLRAMDYVPVQPRWKVTG